MTVTFWLLGVITGIFALKIFQLILEKRLRLLWYHWVVCVLWYGALAFFIAFITINVYEGEPQAASIAFLIFGGGMLVVSILLYRLLFAKRIIDVSTYDAVLSEKNICPNSTPD